MAKRKVVNPLSCHGSSPDASLMRPEEGCCMSFGHVVEAFKSACKPGVFLVGFAPILQSKIG